MKDKEAFISLVISAVFVAAVSMWMVKFSSSPQESEPIEPIEPRGVALQVGPDAAGQVPAPNANPRPTDLQTLDGDVKSILGQVRPCVVTIVSYTNAGLVNLSQSRAELVDPYQKAGKTISSGIVIDSRGIVLTTKDAIPSRQIEVKLYKRKPNVMTAEIIRVDNDLNLALLQIKGVQDLPACQLGDSSQSEVGDMVYAIGSPYGFAETVTAGIISSTRKSLNIEGNVYYNLLQTDAVINEGNNGGPLVDIYGRVVGLNMAIYSENGANTGISFALPINATRQFLRI